LALGVGLLVDNGIVILENIHRQKQRTSSAYEAALTGADEMQNPVLASTLAHIIVFLPIIFVKGMTGHFFYQLALTISFSLLISILVALLLNPMLEARRLSARGPSSGPHQAPDSGRSPLPLKTEIKEVGEARGGMVLGTLWRAMESGMQATERVYLQLLRYSLVNRKRVLLATLLVLLLSLALVPVMGKEFLPQVDQGSFTMKVIFPPGTTMEATDSRTMQIWKILAEEREVKDVFVNIGHDRKEKVEQALGASEPNVANVTVILAEKRGRSVEEVVEAVRPELAQISDAQVEFVLNQDVTQLLRHKQSAPEILEIKGSDLEVIVGLSQEVGNQLKKIPFIEDIKSSLGVSEPEIQISVDRQNAARFQLSVKDIADTVKVAMEGEVATQFRQGDEVDIVVRLRDEDRQDVSSLENILIHTPLGSDIPLKTVANIAKTTRLRQIQRRDLSRIAVVSANIVGITVGEALGKIQKIVKEIKVPPEHSITISAQHEEMTESFKSLSFALVLSVLLVYMLLASLFESFLYPFIIMFSVPLAVVGVILILFVTGTSISLGVYIGGIMLGGLVVNNSIILVDYTNTLRQQGSSREEAVIEGGRARLRPILMTALTTILGLLPLAAGIGKGAEMRSPLAITVIGGLTTSTFMTLIVIPVIYSLFEETRTVKFGGKR
jgi:HAE1 family hydrophobic/amphiphilic exporter-1